MIYPAFLIVISFVAVIYLFAFVLPGIFDVVGQGIEEIPQVALLLKNISDFFVNHWVHIIIGLVVVGLVLSVYAATESGRKNMYRMLLGFPIV